MKKKVLVGVLVALGLISVLVINVNAEKSKTPAQHGNCRCAVLSKSTCKLRIWGAVCSFHFDCSLGGNCEGLRPE